MGRTSLLEVLNVRVVGTGERFLVLSHGFGTDQSAWQKVLPYLVRDYRVVLYDLVCAGSVNPDNFDFARYTSLDPYVDDLLEVLAALRIERCAFVGHSISAMIGCLASIRRPELFTKLVLLGASPRYPPIPPLRSPPAFVLFLLLVPFFSVDVFSPPFSLLRFCHSITPSGG